MKVVGVLDFNAYAPAPTAPVAGVTRLMANDVGQVFVNAGDTPGLRPIQVQNQAQGIWASGGSYTIGQFIYYLGNLFQAKQTHSGRATAPLADGSYWQLALLANPMTADQDLYIGGAAGVPTRLARGNPHQILGVNQSNQLDFTYPVPGGVSLLYTYSNVTTPGDPGVGAIRLNAANQGSASLLDIDDADAYGFSQRSSILALLTLSNHPTMKGFIRVTKADDPTKWILFQCGATTQPSGYLEVAVGTPTWSALSIFANGDFVYLTFIPNGSVGAAEIGTTELANNAVSQSTVVAANNMSTSAGSTAFVAVAGMSVSLGLGTTGRWALSASISGLRHSTAGLYTVWLYINGTPTHYAFRADVQANTYNHSSFTIIFNAGAGGTTTCALYWANLTAGSTSNVDQMVITMMELKK